MKEKIATVSILANIILAGGKIAIGFISNSSAILADGFHSFIDIFSSVVGYIGIKVAKKPADLKHPYGHYKFEVLASFFITLILLVTGLGIIYEAYQKFLRPSFIKTSFFSFGIMIFSIIINEIMARLKIYFGKKENSLALLSDGFHSKVDVFASSAILVGLFLTKYWIFTDPILAILIGFYIIKESFSLGKEAVDSLLDVSAGKEVEEKIRQIAKKENIEIDSLKTQKKGSVIIANLEIRFPSNLKIEAATKISENLRKRLMQEIKNLQYVIIQIKSHDIETNFYQPTLGKGFGWQRRGGFKKELSNTPSECPGSKCVCPQCGYTLPHQKGIPCSTLQCPNCKINLKRL